MCNRFDLHSPVSEVARFYSAAAETNWPGKYNVAPTDPLLAVTADAEGNRRVETMRWGLVHPREKEFKSAYTTFNAKCETAASSATYKAAFRERRCLIPADAFYEWRKPTPKEKLPYRIRVADQPFTTFGGLWEIWYDREARVERKSCTIVTGPANSFMADIHERMPILLRPEQFSTWLSPGDTPSRSRSPAGAILRAYGGHPNQRSHRQCPQSRRGSDRTGRTGPAVGCRCGRAMTQHLGSETLFIPIYRFLI